MGSSDGVPSALGERGGGGGGVPPRKRRRAGGAPPDPLPASPVAGRASGAGAAKGASASVTSIAAVTPDDEEEILSIAIATQRELQTPHTPTQTDEVVEVSAAECVSGGRVAHPELQPAGALEPKDRIPIERCFWVMARASNCTYICKSCGERKTCSSSRAAGHLVGPACGWSLCHSPNPELVQYLSDKLLSRGARKGRKGTRKRQQQQQQQKSTGVKEEAEEESEDSADTARQGHDEAITAPAVRAKAASRGTDSGAAGLAIKTEAIAAGGLGAALRLREIAAGSTLEREKMVTGQMYDASDAGLAEERARARDLMLEYNNTSEREVDRRAKALSSLIPHAKAGLTIQAPFCCDYGSNIYCGESVYMNFNCVILDVSPVTIGARTMFGPGVQVSYTC
jgi:hypothetical protein